MLEYLEKRQAKHQLEVEDLFSQIKRIDKVRAGLSLSESQKWDSKWNELQKRLSWNLGRLVEVSQILRDRPMWE